MLQSAGSIQEWLVSSGNMRQVLDLVAIDRAKKEKSKGRSGGLDDDSSQ